MKSSAASLLTSAALLTAAAADSASTWLEWTSSSTPAPAPVTVTDYKTVDNYITVTYTPPPVYVTVTKTDTATETDVSVSVSGSVATVFNTIVNTVTSAPPPVTVYITSVSVSVSVLESIGTVTDTVTDTVTITSVINSVETTTAPTLSGLVTCPSRTINPTYTPPTPLPSDYLWGCPIGTLCKPPRINCNFEQNPPADTYFCSPDECEPIQPLPPIDDYLSVDVNSTCAFLTPVDDYFNLNPQLFQMDFNIFNIYGNPVCPIIEEVYITVTTTVVSGTTVAVTVPTTIVEYSNVPTTVVSIEYSNVPVPTTVVQTSNVPVPTTVVSYVPTTVVEYETITGSSSWGVWTSTVTKRAVIEDRDLDKRAAALYASACYPACNYAVGVYQSVHLVSALCAAGGDFLRAYRSFTDCTSATPVAAGAGLMDVSLVAPVAYCRFTAQKRDAEPEPTAPAFRFARG